MCIDNENNSSELDEKGGVVLTPTPRDTVEPAPDTDKELWRPVKEDPNVRVSNKGRLKRGRKIQKFKKVNKDGYYACYIKGKTKLLHRVIAETWIPNPDNLPVVDHIDTDKLNNAVSNLRWCTIQQNVQWAADAGLLNKDRSNDRSVVLAFKADQSEVLIFSIIVDCAKYFGVEPHRIRHAIHGDVKTLYGYKILKAYDIIDKRREFDETRKESEWKGEPLGENSNS